MPRKNTTQSVTQQELELVSSILGKLSLQGDYAHMRVPVQAVMGGMLIPQLAKTGAIDAKAPEVAGLISEYTKDKISNQMNPEPVVVKEVVKERKLCRRIKDGVAKVKRFERDLDPSDRDVVIRWWNTNQRLIAKDDPVCVILADQINAINPNEKPLSPMQTAGYLSYLCRLALMTEDHRGILIDRAVRRGKINVRPTFSDELIRLVYENWEYERKNEAAMVKDHMKMVQLREEGDTRTFVADF